MEFYAVVSKTSNSIISYYWSEGVDTTKPGTDHEQSNLVHLIVPEEFRGQHFIKVNPDDYSFEIDQDAVEQSIKEQWIGLREQREKKLSASDWTQFPNNPLTPEKRAEWETYRQALRDLPANTTDPTNVTWPTPP